MPIDCNVDVPIALLSGQIWGDLAAVFARCSANHAPRASTPPTVF
jgi:hypothetical protein